MHAPESPLHIRPIGQELNRRVQLVRTAILRNLVAHDPPKGLQVCGPPNTTDFAVPRVQVSVESKHGHDAWHRLNGLDRERQGTSRCVKRNVHEALPVRSAGHDDMIPATPPPTGLRSNSSPIGIQKKGLPRTG
jgi:hypothetical protein